MCTTARALVCCRVVPAADTAPVGSGVPSRVPRALAAAYAPAEFREFFLDTRK